MRIFRPLQFILSLIALLPALTGAAESPIPKASEAPDGQAIGWRLSGPGGGGWIQSVAFDPLEKDVLYVGCDVGGFYFSTNGGRSFEIRNRGLHDYFLETIAVHPKENRIILLGTESGIHRSTDRGLSWQWIRTGFPKSERFGFSAPIGAICFDPMQPNIVYAGTGRPRWDKSGAGAIYRSENTGGSWHRVDGGQLPSKAIVSTLQVKPGDSRVVLAATSEGVFRSDDAGATWRLSSEGLPQRYTEEIAFAPSAPNVVYVSLRTTARDSEPWNGGVYRSDDAGLTWQPRNGGLPTRVGKRTASPYMNSTIKEIAVDPRNADVLYAGNRSWVSAGIYKSVDGGKAWSLVTHSKPGGNADPGWIKQWGLSVESMAISPTEPDRVVFGTSGHLILSENAGASWQPSYSTQPSEGHVAGNGLETTCAWRVVADPVRPQRAYYCYNDIGLFITDDQGVSFRHSVEGMKMGGNCFGVVVDPQAPATIWAATGWWEQNAGDICRSDDDGKSWRVVGDDKSGLPSGQVLELRLDLKSPVGQRRLLAASNGNGIYESTDGGVSWHAINGNLPSPKEPHGLLLDPADSKHLLIALGRAIYETRDGGQSWQQQNPGSDLPHIQHLTADPTNFGTLYLTGREFYDSKAHRQQPGGLFRSTDAGRSWQRLLDCHRASEVAVSPADPQILYVTTKEDPFFDGAVAEGLLKSRDGGRSWQRENSGLSHLNHNTLCLSPLDPATIYLGTTGNSVFVGRDTAEIPNASSDLTGAGPDSFKAALGKVVSLRGRLSNGKAGLCLLGATPSTVVFYIVPELPPGGSYSYPGSWDRLIQKQVRVTGELKFRTFDHTIKEPLSQAPSDYYYMVLQQSRIECLEVK